MGKIGTPTVSGMKGSLGNFGYGAAGGLFYNLMTNLLGSGLIGGLAGAAIAGSAIKGVKGEIISTMLGFQAGMSLFGGNGGNDAEASDGGVM